MKGPAVDQLVYGFMFPKPRSTDPPNFQALLQRQLVPEVRLETQAFYGHLSSQEAKYPGLDYSYKPHRIRLFRYPWHRRLFRAFDSLALTHSEIAGLTQWEGTRWAKERYEREQGIVIQDTTADGIANWVEPALRTSETTSERQETDNIVVSSLDDQDSEHIKDEGEAEAPMDEEVDEESDTDIQSVGLALNERLRVAVSQREAGDSSTILDEEWEQWFKDAVEAGGLPFVPADFSPHANIPGTRPAIESHSSISPRIQLGARLDHWYSLIARQNVGNSSSAGNHVATSRPRWNSSNPSLTLQSSPGSSTTSTSSLETTGAPYIRSSLRTSSRRLNINPVVSISSRIRQRESQRVSRAPSVINLSAYQTTQNLNDESVS